MKFRENWKMTQSSNSVKGKIHYHQSIIYLTFSLPSLTVKDHKVSSTHYNQTTISRKTETPFTILHQLSKSYLYLRHTVLEKKISPCSASHSLSRKWNYLAKSPPWLKPKVYSLEARRMEPLITLLVTYLFLLLSVSQLFTITDSWKIFYHPFSV